MVLFSRDLRVHDHPALWEACKVADEVVPLFVIDPRLMALSPNRARFLSECIVELDRSFAHRGGRLVVREGDVAFEAVAAAAAMRCEQLFVTDDVSDFARRRLVRLQGLCSPLGIGVRTFPGHSVVEPGAVAPQGRDAYRVFTPYLGAWRKHHRRPVLSAPKAVHVPRDMESGRLPLPSAYRPTAIELPPGGESAARKRMRGFLADGARGYQNGRNDLAGGLTSRLSPYVRFGCVSAAELAEEAGRVEGAEEFVRQIAWRDFFMQLLSDEPTMTWRDLRSGPTPGGSFDPAILEAWKAGRTGLPLVDAGMRQLHREGWMHNRARLTTASYLTRRAGVAWQEGARHFSWHLVDGDPANNVGNWQWVAGTGAAPRRSRALNPVRQARRFDPSGDYVRRHVRELSHVKDERVFQPWIDPDLLRSTGYPAPILEVPAA